MGMRSIDITGQQFGRWTVIRYLGSGRWECRCQCGEVRSVRSTLLMSGKSKSCGCYRADVAGNSGNAGRKLIVSAETRAKMSAAAKKRGMPEEVRLKGIKKKAESELGGRTPSNRSAKMWCLISPEHEMYEVSNLRDFVRRHDDLFLINGEDDREITRICMAFSLLKHNMRIGKQRTCCNGWTIVIPDDDRINKYKK